MSLFAGEGAQEEGDNGAGRSHRRAWERREWGPPGQKALREGETRCFIFRPGIKVGRVHSRKHGKHKKEKGQARSFPLSHQLGGTLGSREMEPSESPEPTTKGHSQSGLLTQRSRCPGAALARGQAGTFRPRTQSRPCGGRGAGAPGASDSKTSACLLTALQAGRRETGDGKTDLGRQRDASPDSGWAIFGNGSTLLGSCRLGATGLACICPLECSLKRLPPRLGRASTPPRGWGRQRLAV